MAHQLKLNREWRSQALIMTPGVYLIPKKISRTLAKCAVADGAGQIEEVEAVKKHRASRKSTAPENKAIHAAPNDKAAVDAMHCGGDRPEPDARGSGRLPGA